MLTRRSQNHNIILVRSYNKTMDGLVIKKIVLSFWKKKKIVLSFEKKIVLRGKNPDPPPLVKKLEAPYNHSTFSHIRSQFHSNSYFTRTTTFTIDILYCLIIHFIINICSSFTNRSTFPLQYGRNLDSCCKCPTWPLSGYPTHIIRESPSDQGVI